MNLRGERGITAVKKRRWWLQNWFILMVVAGAAAFAAWALIEPFFDDMVHINGQITNLSPSQAFSVAVGNNSGLSVPATGWVRVGEVSYWIMNDAKLWVNNKPQPFDWTQIKVGQTVDIYCEALSTQQNQELAFVHFLDPNPSASTKPTEKTLTQLRAQHTAASLLLFPMVAGLVGLCLGAADGIVCRMPRRAILSGLVGLLIGVLGGFVSEFVAGLAYEPLSHLATRQGLGEGGKLPPFAFFVQMTGRGIAWLLAGMAMGLGQGIALRSKRLLLYGFLGGIVGGLLGGLLFDPIDLLILGTEKPSAHIARMVGFTVIGLFVGAMIGIVELLARDAWLRMTEGPLTGKEFLLFKDVMRIGSSSRSDLYLFNDPQVAEAHAQIRTSGDHSEIQSDGPDKLVLVNGRPTRSTRLRHGDQITIGRTSFLFQSRKG
jgi:hypothetical protein